MEKLKFTLETTLEEFLAYHFEPTREMCEMIGATEEEWKLIWSKNYYQERCKLLEKKLGII